MNEPQRNPYEPTKAPLTEPTSHVPKIVMPWLRELYLAVRTELQQYPARE